jgi:hypothetical protein
MSCRTTPRREGAAVAVHTSSNENLLAGVMAIRSCVPYCAAALREPERRGVHLCGTPIETSPAVPV